MDAARTATTQELTPYILAPPYDQPQELGDTSIASYRRPGALLLVRPGHKYRLWTLIQWLERSQAGSPSATVALWLDLLTNEAACPAISAAANYGVRGIIRRPIISVPTLRDQLNEPSYFSHDIPHRLKVMGFQILTPVMALLDAICCFNHKYKRLTTLLEAAKLNYQQVRRSTMRVGLATPERFHQVIRMVLIASHLQREIKSPVAAIAHRYGYFDDAALRARLRDVLGVQPTHVRSFLGWERPLYYGLRRSCLSPRTVTPPG